MTLNVLNDSQCQRITQNLPLGNIEKSFSKDLQRDRLLLMLMLDAGLRVGEVVQLRLRHLFTDGALNTAVNIAAEISKSGWNRTVPLSENLKIILDEYLEKSYVPEIGETNNYLFPGRPDSEHLSARQVRRIVRHRCFSYLAVQVKPHDLRHTFATRLMRTTNIRVVQTLLGHQSIQSTQVYTHPDNTDLAKAIASV